MIGSHRVGSGYEIRIKPRLMSPGPHMLHLPCRGNILFFRSEAGRTNGWAQAHFFVGRLECTADRLRSGSLYVDLAKVRDAAERVARSEGLEIVDVEWKIGKQRFLRVYIDKLPDGSDGSEVNDPYPKISHADCQRVSQQLSVILDVEDLIPGPAYVLEVSSPGMDRELRKPAEFERFKGRLAKISTTEPVGDAKFFEGRLAGFADGKVRMELKGKEPRTIELPLETIRKANLVVEF